MQTFEQFFYEKQVIPPILTINIKNIGQFNAKADTGNQGYNVLHATKIQNNGETVSFVCNGKNHNAPSYGTMEINKGPEMQENRCVIKLDVTVLGKLYRDQPFTVTDRSGMDTPVLLSGDFISQMNGVVDPSIT